MCTDTSVNLQRVQGDKSSQVLYFGNPSGGTRNKKKYQKIKAQHIHLHSAYTNIYTHSETIPAHTVPMLHINLPVSIFTMYTTTSGVTTRKIL